jgi:DNA-3-methyladenine glycosylase II
MKHARKATDHLRRSDPRLAEVVARVGPIRLTPQQCSPFESLTRAIVYQQLSGKAAATIFGRLRERCRGEISPERVGGLADAEMRAAGISPQKLGYLRDLARHTRGGELDFPAIVELDDEAVIERLTAVKGIGRWSAEMFLMFYLCRPDVLPTGDLGIRKAAQSLYRLRKLPEPERLTKIAEPWRPFRTAACWYLWRSLEAEAAIGA